MFVIRSHARVDNYILLCLYKYTGWRNKHEAYYPNDCSQTYPCRETATAIGARQEHIYNMQKQVA